ncbi:hypothetical protein QBC34DRAFT_310329, partial [Podospora aff. communis PSN243]
YRGDLTIERNRSAKININDSCSFWLEGLPANLTVTTFLANIRNVGRVYSSRVYPPFRNIPTSAAKVVFVTTEASRTFFRRCLQEGFMIDGHAATVVHHRVLAAEMTGLRKTRVLVITGPSTTVNVRYLEAQWRRWLHWQLDKVVQRWTQGHETSIEYHFGSVQGQSEAAAHAMRCSPDDFPGVRFCYGADPCA